jgi:DNA-binding PadR family transcriptional regulator
MENAPQIGDSQKPTTASEQERHAYDLWERHKLNTHAFSPGSLIAFLKNLTP